MFSARLNIAIKILIFFNSFKRIISRFMWFTSFSNLFTYVDGHGLQIRAIGCEGSGWELVGFLIINFILFADTYCKSSLSGLSRFIFFETSYFYFFNIAINFFSQLCFCRYFFMLSVNCKII